MITTYNNPLRNFWDIWKNKSLRNFGIVGFFWNRMGNSWFVKFLNRVPFSMSLDGSGRNFLAQKPLRTKKNAQQFFSTESSPHRSLTRRRFYAQHFLHTDAFTYWCIYTDTNCRQKLVHTARVYTANFYTERLRFPFLITYLSCSPSQVLSGHGVFFVLKPWFWTCPAWLITNTLKLRPALRWRQWVAHYGTYIEDFFYCTY